MHIKDITEIEDEEMGLDLGPNTIELFKNYLKDAKESFMEWTTRCL